MTKALLRVSLLSALLLLIMSPEIFSQCPMCKMAAESNLDHGGTAGAGLNKGILFMLSMPYLIVACLGFVWYKNRTREEDHALAEVNDLLQNDHNL